MCNIIECKEEDSEEEDIIMCLDINDTSEATEEELK